MLASLAPLLVEAIFEGGGRWGHGLFIKGEDLIQCLYLKGTLIRYEAFIWEWAFVRSLTVFLNDVSQ